jgi:hypothetical protein
MRQNNPLAIVIESFETDNPEETLDWPNLRCEQGETEVLRDGLFFGERDSIRLINRLPASYAADWADKVPELLAKVVSLLTEKRKQELRFNFLQVTLSDYEKRIHKLECAQTKIIPVASFIPEPYMLLRTIFVSVNSIEGGFNAGWFDANIHSSGDNEEEAVANLKSLILDVFDNFTSEPAENLGPEPARQLAVLRHYIQRKA